MVPSKAASTPGHIGIGAYANANLTKLVVNITLDLEQIINVNDQESLWSVKASMNTFWYDSWATDLDVAAHGFNYDMCLLPFLQRNGCLGQLGTADLTNCKLYDHKGRTSWPQLQFENEFSSTLVGPRREELINVGPFTEFTDLVNKWGASRYNIGTCQVLNAFSECPFNVVWQGQTKIVTFQNTHWNMAWYPFDSRILYVNIIPTRMDKYDYRFPQLPATVRLPPSVGWHSPTPMTCRYMMKLNPLIATSDEGFRCEFEIQRGSFDKLFETCLPLTFGILTAWASFFAPVSAAMPRVAVTALAYVAMGSTLNALTTKLPPSGDDLYWIQVVVGFQLILCMKGTVMHLIIFRCHAKPGKSQLMNLINRTMRWYIPVAYGLSFGLGTAIIASTSSSQILFYSTVLVWFIITTALTVTLYHAMDSSVDKDHAKDSSVDDSAIKVHMTSVGISNLQQQGPSAQLRQVPAPHLSGGIPGSPAARGGVVGGDEPPLALTRVAFDDIFSELFSRYDFDHSGTLNSGVEFQQLTLNLIYKLHPSRGGDTDEIMRVCAAVLPQPSDENEWSPGQFIQWFKRTFGLPHIINEEAATDTSEGSGIRQRTTL